MVLCRVVGEVAPILKMSQACQALTCLLCHLLIDSASALGGAIEIDAMPPAWDLCPNDTIGVAFGHLPEKEAAY